MPTDELPMYPTPQQASYTVSPPHQHRKPPQTKPTTAYRPAKQFQYDQYQQYKPQHQYQAPPQQQYNPPPQQYNPPPQQYNPPPQQYNPPPQQYNPPPQQYNPPPQQYNPPPQQYQPSYQQSQPPPQHNQPLQSPVSQYSNGHKNKYYENQVPAHSNPPPQPISSHQPSKKPPSRAHTQPSHSPVMKQTVPSSASVSSHKKPPPSEKSRSKESLADEKAMAKQKLEQELRQVFHKVDTNKSGRISAQELSQALLNFDSTRFQESTVTLMVKLFSSSSDVSAAPLRSLNFEQFVSLWKYLSAYKKLFLQADTNKSGDISFGEFQKIIETIGYKLNIDLVLNMFQKFASPGGAGVGKLKFDAFIELLVYLRKLTDIFKKYDKDLSGVATISFSDFLFEVSNLT